MMMNSKRFVAFAAILPVLYIARRGLTRLRSRTRRIYPAEERVLILGASGGVGQAIAKQYAARGAKVCVVARRTEQVSLVAAECGDKCMGLVADFTKAEDMIKVRESLVALWGGIDTLHVCAGVSALRPVMEIAGGEFAEGTDTTEEGVRAAVEIAGRATQGNFVGPLVSALVFIPTLIRTSVSPSILLVSSLAALIPAPTRALYAATKASSLLLFQALSIEHPGIAFVCMIPSTIDGNFRASAVDGGPVREADPSKSGLKVENVARRCISAVDAGGSRNVFVPWFPYFIGHFIYYLFPSFVEWRARVKYHYP